MAYAMVISPGYWQIRNMLCKKIMNPVDCLKDLLAVDHEKIYYRPFKKDFYVEVPEIANMTTEGNLLFTSHLSQSTV